MKFITLLLVFAAGIAVGVLLSAKYREIPTEVAKFLFSEEVPPGDEDMEKDRTEKIAPPTLEQINEILSGSRALVESQHAYYVHVTRNGKFAENVRELGSRKESGGTVMVLDVWNASDAVAAPAPLHGYLFKILQVSVGSEKKKGFVVFAYPADERNDGPDWPLFTSFIPDAKGGFLGMTSRDTWEIGDTAAAAKIRALLQRSEISLADLKEFSPEKLATSIRIENFKKEGE